jgi:ketosteroid isomerase-like protein
MSQNQLHSHTLSTPEETNMTIKTKIFLSACVAFGMLAAMAAAGVPGASADDEKTVAALDTRYQAAVEKNDADTMDRILADDFVLVMGSGKTQSKADLLEEARSGRTIYEHQDDALRTVRVWGDTAVVTARLHAKGAEAGKSFEYTLWFSDTYVRTSAGWRYVFAQASLPLPRNP